jgi:hypothetical protein
MSIAVEILPLPHRRHFEIVRRHRCRTAMLRKAKVTAPLPHRIQIESDRTAAAPQLIEDKPTAAAPRPRRYYKHTLNSLLFFKTREYVLLSLHEIKAMKMINLSKFQLNFR